MAPGRRPSDDMGLSEVRPVKGGMFGAMAPRSTGAMPARASALCEFRRAAVGECLRVGLASATATSSA